MLMMNLLQVLVNVQVLVNLLLFMVHHEQQPLKLKQMLNFGLY